MPFESLTESHPPDAFAMLVAMGFSKMNQARAEVCRRCEERGYELISYVSSRAITWDQPSIGKNCFIFENNVIQPFVTIGDNTVIWSGNHLGHHAQIGDHCFITSHAVISGGVKIGDHCFIGVNSTIRDHVTVAPRCVIGAGALILKDTQADWCVHGQPCQPVPCAQPPAQGPVGEPFCLQSPIALKCRNRSVAPAGVRPGCRNTGLPSPGNRVVGTSRRRSSSGQSRPIEKNTPHVAVLVDTATGWGRRLVRGVVNYSQHGPWYLWIKSGGQDAPLWLPPGWRGDGIIARIGTLAAARHIRTVGVPAVNISAIELPGVDFPRVATDLPAAGRLAAGHLLDRGVRPLCLLWPGTSLLCRPPLWAALLIAVAAVCKRLPLLWHNL